METKLFFSSMSINEKLDGEILTALKGLNLIFILLSFVNIALAFIFYELPSNYFWRFELVVLLITTLTTISSYIKRRK